MNISKARKLKVNVMRALQQNEDSNVKKEIIGALIEDELTEEELPAIESRDVADATRQIAQSVTAALPAPTESAPETIVDPVPDQPAVSTETPVDQPAAPPTDDALTSENKV